MGKYRRAQEKQGWAMWTAAFLLKPPLLALMKRDWVNGDQIPAKGGCILAINHISHLDPLASAHLVYDHGRHPRYLAKSGLFKNRFLGGFLTAAGQIPVERMTADALSAFGAAVEAIKRGECVIVYVEGTITRDPDLWPMRGKSGAARIALASGAPVIPVGQWGAQEILAPYAKRFRFFPRKTIHMRVGPPVDLDDLRSQQHTPAVIQQATDRIMAAITRQVELIRGQQAPAERFDPRKAGVKEIGNPNRKDDE